MVSFGDLVNASFCLYTLAHTSLSFSCVLYSSFQCLDLSLSFPISIYFSFSKTAALSTTTVTHSSLYFAFNFSWNLITLTSVPSHHLSFFSPFFFPFFWKPQPFAPQSLFLLPSIFLSLFTFNRSPPPTPWSNHLSP